MPKRVYDKAYASFRVWGDELDPLNVTLLLRMPPDRAYRQGEPHLIRTKKGKVMELPARRQGMWAVSSKDWVESPRLATHLDWLLEQLEPKHEAVAALIKLGYGVDFFCFSSGSTASPPSLPKTIRARAAALGIDIDIDHYEDRQSSP